MNPDSDQLDRTNIRRRFPRWAVVSLAVACSLLLLWMFSGTRFDSAKWHAQSGYDPIRLEMVDDLMRRHRLVGMSRENLDELLGVPPDTAYSASFDYVYWLGPERGFISIDSEWLCLKFSDDVVVDARITRD